MAAEVFNPDALSTSGDSELDARPGVQEVDESMISRFVVGANELPAYSALPFSVWAYNNWEEFNPDGVHTNSEVLDGMLSDWCGGRTKETPR